MFNVNEFICQYHPVVSDNNFIRAWQLFTSCILKLCELMLVLAFVTLISVVIAISVVVFSTVFVNVITLTCIRVYLLAGS